MKAVDDVQSQLDGAEHHSAILGRQSRAAERGRRSVVGGCRPRAATRRARPRWGCRRDAVQGHRRHPGPRASLSMTRRCGSARSGGPARWPSCRRYARSCPRNRRSRRGARQRRWGVSRGAWHVLEKAQRRRRNRSGSGGRFNERSPLRVGERPSLRHRLKRRVACSVWKFPNVSGSRSRSCCVARGVSFPRTRPRCSIDAALDADGARHARGAPRGRRAA